jgi:hypothetical protein
MIWALLLWIKGVFTTTGRPWQPHFVPAAITAEKAR